MLKDYHIAGEGNTYYTLFREYDPTPGRWWNADSLRTKYPDMSPYLAFGANPICLPDVIGDDLIHYRTNGSKDCSKFEKVIKQIVLRNFTLDKSGKKFIEVIKAMNCPKR